MDIENRNKIFIEGESGTLIWTQLHVRNQINFVICVHTISPQRSTGEHDDKEYDEFDNCGMGPSNRPQRCHHKLYYFSDSKQHPDWHEWHKIHCYWLATQYHVQYHCYGCKLHGKRPSWFHPRHYRWVRYHHFYHQQLLEFDEEQCLENKFLSQIPLVLLIR